MSIRHVAALLLLAACARSEKVPEEALVEDDAVTTAAPALEAAASADAVEPEPAVIPAKWSGSARGEGMMLRLVAEDDTELMSLSCANVPREFVVTVPGFTRDPNDSRFSLALGGAPVILVADVVTMSGGVGVTARTPAHESLPVQLESAESVTAHYGTQTLGPYSVPDVKLQAALIEACGLTKPAAPQTSPQ